MPKVCVNCRYLKRVGSYYYCEKFGWHIKPEVAKTRAPFMLVMVMLGIYSKSSYKIFRNIFRLIIKSMEKKMNEKYKRYYEAFKRIFNVLFPSALSWVNFMLMWFFMAAMVYSAKIHEPLQTLISGLATIYCLNEWDKRMRRKWMRRKLK